MSSTNFTSIDGFIENHKKGTFGVYGVTITEPTFKSKKSEFQGKVYKATFIQNAILGITYEGALNGVAKRNGLDDIFKPSTLPWGNWTNYPYTIEHKEQKYLRLFKNKATKMLAVYLYNGEEVDPNSELMAKIKAELRPKSASRKQSAYGIDEEEQVIPLTYKYDSICYLLQKDNCYMKNLELTHVTREWIKNIFKKM